MPRYTLVSYFFLFALVLGGCNYTMKVRTGDMAYEVKQYAVAVELLNKEYNKAKTRLERGELAYKLGLSYKELNQTDQAIKWFLTAYDYGAGVDALREYAYALKRDEQYEEAVRAFRDLGIEVGSPYEYRREIRSCEVAMGWKEEDRPEYEVEVALFNTGNADYSPYLYTDNQLVISSDRAGSTGDDTYKWTGNAFSDLFVVDLGSNAVTKFDPPINTPDNEGTVAFNADFTEIYFSRCFGEKKTDQYCKLMVSTRSGDSWSEPVTLPFVQAEINYGHPSLSEDGQYLYFSANHPDGWGGYDIWVSERGPDGWGAPVVMSRSINTIGNEKFPSVDGDTLYFSSDFHPGMGGLDIFYSYQLSNGSWAPAYNLKPPVNSGADDFGFIIDYEAELAEDELQHGYFTSTRDDGIGGDDIYAFTRIVPPPAPDTPAIAEEIEYKMILNGFVLERVYEIPGDQNSRVLARKPLPGATVEIQAGEQPQTVTVGEDGLFTLELEENTAYDFIASKEGYLNNDASFSTVGIGQDPNNPVQTFEIEIVLREIVVNTEITLENIYYDFDRWEIRPDAEPTLNQLARALELNPDINIILGSHTDCRGNNAYNETLSQRRAQSAVDFLVEAGISRDRLQAQGFGESSPAVDCVCSRCTEEQHQENRRTTFTILGEEPE